MNEINTEEYWNNKYKQLYEDNKNCLGGNEFMRMWFQNLFLHNNSIILELGCGNASFYEFLKSHNKKVNYIGVDISDYIIKKNKEKYPECTFLHTIDDIELIKEKVDYIYCMHVIEHIEEPEKFINKWLNVLKPKGFLVLSVPYLDDEYPEHLRIYDEKECDNFANKLENVKFYEFYIRRLGWNYSKDGRTAKELVMFIVKNE